MATFLELQDRIADDLNRTDLTEQIKKAINRAIQRYQKKKFWFQETTASFSLVAGQEVYVFGVGSVPSDIQDITSLTLERTANDDYPIYRTTFQEIRRLNDTQGTSTGTPNLWTLYNESFYFSPVPNDTDTINLYYYQNYADLVNDADTNDFTNNAQDLIEARARWWINLRVLKDRASASDDKQEELEALFAINEQNKNFQSSRGIQPYAF